MDRCGAARVGGAGQSASDGGLLGSAAGRRHSFRLRRRSAARRRRLFARRRELERRFGGRSRRVDQIRRRAFDHRGAQIERAAQSGRLGRPFAAAAGGGGGGGAAKVGLELLGILSAGRPDNVEKGLGGAHVHHHGEGSGEPGSGQVLLLAGGSCGHQAGQVR